jgi:hypothetical protein
VSYTVNPNLERQFAARLEAGRKAAGDFLVQKARGLAPRRTGRLRRSVGWGPGPGRLGVRLFAAAPYAPYVEARRHFLAETLRRHGRQALELLARVARGG